MVHHLHYDQSHILMACEIQKVTLRGHFANIRLLNARFRTARANQAIAFEKDREISKFLPDDMDLKASSKQEAATPVNLHHTVPLPSFVEMANPTFGKQLESFKLF